MAAVLASTSRLWGNLFWIGGLLGVLVVAAMVAFVILRRWLRPSSGAEGPAAGFTLAELRELRDSGQISNEEFDDLRSKIIQQQRP